MTFLKTIPLEIIEKLIFCEGNKVKNLRIYKNLTSKQLSELADVSEERLESIEQCKIRLIDSDLTKIATALDVDAELLQDMPEWFDNLEKCI